MMNISECFLGESSKMLDKVLKQYHPGRVLLIRGKNSFETSGAKGKILPLLKKNGILYRELSDFSINPKENEIRIGLEILEQERFDLILAVGGGSVIDMAKLVRFFFSYQGKIEENKYQRCKDTIPLVALPTTAGTGSESTHFAVVYKGDTKYSVAHPAILPDVAIVDPAFTYHNPAYLTAVTGFDALSQAIEAYWNIHATEESDRYAESAIKLLAGNLPILIHDLTNTGLRGKVAEGASLAGKAINITKTTAPHAFSYPFTTGYGYPHGHAVAMTFPFFMEFNGREDKLVPSIDKKEYSLRMQHLYSWLGFDTGRSISRQMTEYILQLGISLQLPEHFDSQHIIHRVNTERLGNNPCKMTGDDIARLTKLLKKQDNE